MSKVPVDADNVLQMASKKRRPLDNAPADPDESSDKTVIRVRRGALRRFDQLKQKSTNLPVEIKWDRRLGERRAGGGTDTPEADLAGAGPRKDGSRKQERRKTPPFTWDVADFVVVGSEPPDEK